MSALEAARIGDQIGHTCAMSGLLTGLVVGLIVAAVVVASVAATIATAGAAAVLIGGVIAGVAGAGLAGMNIGATIDSDPKGPISSGSPNTFLGTGMRAAARAVVDTVACLDHSLKLIAQGSIDVFINNQPAARRTDGTVCSALIREGQPDVFFGGPTGTYLDMESEVPGWLVTTLEWAMYIGAGIATAGVWAAVSFGAAVCGLLGSLAGGWVGAKVGGAIGGLFGRTGEAIGEAIGGFAGSILGGMGGGKLYEGFAGRAPAPTVRPIDEVQARLTPAERATYQESMRIANEEPIQTGQKTFYSGRGGPEAADAFVGRNPEYVRLENGTRAGEMLQKNSEGLNSALDRSTGDQRLPYNPPEGVSGEGYGVEPWNRVSSRYGDATEGSAQAFVENSGQQSVFRNAELPRLLENPNVDRVVFRNNDQSIAGEWTRGADGKWSGDPIANDNGAFDLSDPRYAGPAGLTPPAPTTGIPIYTPSPDNHP